jgi:arylsulfatase A-like enzyme
MLRLPLVSLLLALSGSLLWASPQPNILFILADDMGWSDSSVVFGDRPSTWNRHFDTPALERLAAEGMKFSQAYSCAVCSPTRVSLLTGMNQVKHAVTQWTYLSGETSSSDLPIPGLELPDWNWNGLQPEPGMRRAFHKKTLPEWLQDAGYRTMHFGKGHLGARGTPGADPKPFGYDIRIGGRDAGGCGSYSGLKNFAAGGNLDVPWRAWDVDAYFGQDIHLTEVLTLEAKKHIREAVEEEVPFFCMMAHYAPHTPIEPDERFAPAYRDRGYDETEAAYASLIAGVDKSTGDLLELLDELDIADNTLVVFTSDNGGVSHKYRSGRPHTHNLPLSSGKGSHHEGGIRVPLLVRWPGVTPSGSRQGIPVIIYDWFPTLLRAAGMEAADLPRTDGKDLKPLLEVELERAPRPFARALAWHFPHSWGPLQRPGPVEGPGLGPASAIRFGPWKFIYYHTPGKEPELFHLEQDMGEQYNRVWAEPDITLMMARLLTGYLKESPYPLPAVDGKPLPYPDAFVEAWGSEEPGN